MSQNVMQSGCIDHVTAKWETRSRRAVSAAGITFIAGPGRFSACENHKPHVRCHERVEMNREEDRHKEGAVNDVGPRGKILVVGPVTCGTDPANPPEFGRVGPHCDQEHHEHGFL